MTFPSVQLLACYELGHQPLSLAWPLAFLKEAGIEAQGHDLSIESFPEQKLSDATFVGISVPMHTALRLGVPIARKIRKINPAARIAFLGYYAQLNADYLLEGDPENNDYPLADYVFSGEFEDQLIELVGALRNNGTAQRPLDTPGAVKKPSLNRLTFPIPDRSNLPSLSHYSRFVQNGISKLAGYAETSRGCLHTCRHCPVVPIYGGRFFVTQQEVVLADIGQQVDAGAEHITFGDPDFLNGPVHSLRTIREMNHQFPDLSFDFTTKVEHIIEKSEVIEELAKLGAAFVVSAFESTSDRVLEYLNKGHTRADMEAALTILDKASLPVQPTWVPFTPWTSLHDYLDMLRWIRENNLIGSIPPVQYSIRLLVPPNSALMQFEESKAWFGKLNPEGFVHEWLHPDPYMDALQKLVANIAELAGDDYVSSFTAIEREAYRVAGKEAPSQPLKPILARPPKLTEDWFC